MLRKRLYVKMIFWIGLTLCIFLGAAFSITSYYTLRSLNEEFENSTRHKAELLMNAIYNNIASTTESGHMQQLIRMTELVKSYSELQQLVIFSQDGIILQSLDPKDVGRKISEIHYDVYKQDEIKGRAYDVGVRREFCLVRPLRNIEQCYGCHDSRRRVLGILDVCLSMEGTQERLARNRTILYTAGGISALATIMATSLAIALLVGLLVNRPVSHMVAAIRGVEKGDLEARVNINSSDELGVMGHSFNSMIDTIKRLNELKDDFISIVSHELRTPLTSIKYFSEVMLERIGMIQESRQKKYLRVINDETDRLTRLINDLLDLQKISSGKFRWKEEEIDIRKAIGSTLQTFTGAAASRNVRLVERIEPNLPVVFGDRDKAVQLIANLLSNAIKFTRVGSRVTISAEQGEDPDMLLDTRFRKYVRISVRDEGLGITPENLEKIFEKFQQVEDSVTRSKGGTGLGLSISKEIVQHHGGKIWAESAIPAGSIFSFTLPCERVERGPGRKDPSGALEVESREGKGEPKEHAGAPKRT